MENSGPEAARSALGARLMSEYDSELSKIVAELNRAAPGNKPASRLRTRPPRSTSCSRLPPPAALPMSC